MNVGRGMVWEGADDGKDFTGRSGASALEFALGHALWGRRYTALAPQRGNVDGGVFQVIQAASAFTSSRVTLGWKRMRFSGPARDVVLHTGSR